eukprot:gene3624-4061_t
MTGAVLGMAEADPRTLGSYNKMFTPDQEAVVRFWLNHLSTHPQRVLMKTVLRAILSSPSLPADLDPKRRLYLDKVWDSYCVSILSLAYK